MSNRIARRDCRNGRTRMRQRVCAHCGRVGHTYGSLNGAPLYHPTQGLDCYRLVTVYREPIGARLPGQPLHGAPDPIRSRTVPEAPF